jgi:cell division protein FtsQ
VQLVAELVLLNANQKMSIRSNIKKILFISFWCTLGAGMLVLLVAAMRVKKEKDCVGYNIDISSPTEQLFIDKKDIEEQLTAGGVESIKGKSIKDFDLKKLEDKLEQNVWISDAELFFDNNQVLQVKIKERNPIARIFTISGNSFYIDSATVRLPLSEKFSARLPVFTGFPSDKDRLSKKEKELLKQVKTISQNILSNEFWMAQVAQVDITSSGTFEIIPTIGHQVIEFGDGSDCEKKFNRLLLFYRQVISETGFQVYERIKVQYAGQVVGVRQAAAISRFDSLQAIKNVEKMIAMAQTEQERMLKMDSLQMATMQHRSDNQGAPAPLVMPDSVTEKPNTTVPVKQIREKRSKQ